MENGKLRCSLWSQFYIRAEGTSHLLQLSIFNFQFFLRVHIARRVQGLVLILLRSLQTVNEEAKSKA
jgi:hypothetical protein